MTDDRSTLAWWVTGTDEEFTKRFHEELPRITAYDVGIVSPSLGLDYFSGGGFPLRVQSHARRADLQPYGRSTRRNLRARKHLGRCDWRELIDFESLGF